MGARLRATRGRAAKYARQEPEPYLLSLQVVTLCAAVSVYP